VLLAEAFAGSPACEREHKRSDGGLVKFGQDRFGAAANNIRRAEPAYRSSKRGRHRSRYGDSRIPHCCRWFSAVNAY
jgi:hypothetical protein